MLTCEDTSQDRHNEQSGATDPSQTASGRCLVRISAGTPTILTEVFRDFLQYLYENANTASPLDHDSFLPSLFQFHQSYHHPTLHIMRYRHRREINYKKKNTGLGGVKCLKLKCRGQLCYAKDRGERFYETSQAITFIITVVLNISTAL